MRLFKKLAVDRSIPKAAVRPFKQVAPSAFDHLLLTQDSAASCWSLYTSWLHTTIPAEFERLNPPFDTHDLALFRETAGFDFPSELSEIYSINDGGGELKNEGRFFGAELMPIKSITRSLQTWSDIANDPALAALNQDARSLSPGVVKANYANPGWVPFLSDFMGNNIGIDLDPDVSGTPGQVIIFGRDEEAQLVTPSLRALLVYLLGRIEAGSVFLVHSDDGSIDSSLDSDLKNAVSFGLIEDLKNLKLPLEQ